MRLSLPFPLCLCASRVWELCVWDADLYRRFYGPYEGSCFIEENRRQRWWGEEGGEACIDWTVHSTIHEDNRLSLLTSARPASFPLSSHSLSFCLFFCPFCFPVSLLSPHFLASVLPVRSGTSLFDFFVLFISAFVWLPLLPLNNTLYQNKSQTLKLICSSLFCWEMWTLGHGCRSLSAPPPPPHTHTHILIHSSCIAHTPPSAVVFFSGCPCSCIVYPCWWPSSSHCVAQYMRGVGVIETHDIRVAHAERPLRDERTLKSQATQQMNDWKGFITRLQNPFISVSLLNSCGFLGANCATNRFDSQLSRLYGGYI